MIVLDACALVDAVLDQPAAGWVLDEIAGEEVCAPAHQPAEILSALARLVRTAQIDLESARDALDEALALPQRLITPTAGHLRRAFALRDRIRVVDGLYVALADELDCPLVTWSRPTAGLPPRMRPARSVPPRPNPPAGPCHPREPVRDRWEGQ